MKVKKAKKMSLIFRILAFSVLCFFQISQVFAKSEWFELKTEHFQISGNVGKNEIQTVEKKLTQFQQIFEQHFPKHKIQIPFPTNIIVFKDEAESDIYKIKSNPKETNDWFLSANDANFGLIALDNNLSLAQNFNGYAKFLLENNFGRNILPPWLFEGLAEHFETFQLTKDGAEFGVSTGNQQILQQNKLIPFNVIFETDYFTLQNQGAERKNLFRAQSWALLKLLLKNESDFTKIEKFLELRKQGIEPRVAVTQAFQISFADLNTEFEGFINQNEFQKHFGKIQFVTESSKKTEVSQITEAKGFALFADYLFYANNFREAEKLIEKSLQLDPNQTLAITTLALIKAKTFYPDEAEKLAEKAIEIEPDNFLNYYRMAVGLSKRGMTEFGFVSGYNSALANRMRENLLIAIKLNPTFTESFALLSFVNFVRNEELDSSIPLINQALKTATGNHQYQLRLAELNLRKEKFFEARKLAIQVLQNTPLEGVKLYAQNTIQRIDATEYQLSRIRNEKTKYVNDEIVTEKPLSEAEIRKLREKAINDQIKVVLRRPKPDEFRIIGNLNRIECGKNKVDFFVSTPTGQVKIQANSLDGINLLSLVEEMSDYRLGCGTMVRENLASIIYKKNPTKTDELVSIEFIPKGFKL